MAGCLPGGHERIINNWYVPEVLSSVFSSAACPRNAEILGQKNSWSPFKEYEMEAARPAAYNYKVLWFDR